MIVARRFFSSPSVVGLASGVSFPDALSGGALLGRVQGPLVLTAPTELPTTLSGYLDANAPSIDDVFVIGGESAIARGVADAAVELVN